MLFRYIRKKVKDFGSGAKDILRNNPEALMIGAAMFGLPALMGKTGGGGGGGFTDFLSNILGQTAQTVDKCKGINRRSGLRNPGHWPESSKRINRWKRRRRQLRD